MIISAKILGIEVNDPSRFSAESGDIISFLNEAWPRFS